MSATILLLIRMNEKGAIIMTTKEYIEELKKEAQKAEIRAIAADDKAEQKAHMEKARKKRELRNNLLKLWGGVSRAVRNDSLKAM